MLVHSTKATKELSHIINSRLLSSSKVTEFEQNVDQRPLNSKMIN